MSELLIKNKITGEWEAIPYIVGSQGPKGADGSPGKNGTDGITPHIGDNGNWFIGEEDTGVSTGVTDEQINGALESYMEDNPLVKTVNGFVPDENGNVKITIPDSVLGVDSAGKKWLFIGDSITEHNFRATKNYDQFLSEWLGIVSINRGMSGTGVNNPFQGNPSWLDDLANYPTDVDCISIMGALNDRRTALGAWGDRGTDTAYGAVWNYFNQLIEKYPNKPIIYITSTPRDYSYGVDGQYTAWVDAFIETAHNFSIPVLDLYRESGLRPWNATNNATYFSCNSAPNGDGVHPNALGQELMARKICDFAKVHLFGLAARDSSEGGDDDAGSDNGRKIDVGAWESGALPNGGEADSDTVIRTGFIDVADCSYVLTKAADGYSVAVYGYLYEHARSLVNSPTWTTGTVEHSCSSINYIRIVAKRNDGTNITPDIGSNALLSVVKYGSDTFYEPDTIDLGDWENGGIRADIGELESTTLLRTVNYIDISGYEKIIAKYDAAIYRIAVFFYDTVDAVQSLNGPTWDTSGYVNILRDLPKDAKYMRITISRVDGGEMNVGEASAVTAFEQ